MTNTATPPTADRQDPATRPVVRLSVRTAVRAGAAGSRWHA